MENNRERENQFLNSEKEKFSKDDFLFKEDIDNKIIDTKDKQKIEAEDKNKLSEIKKQLGIEEVSEKDGVMELVEFEKKYQEKLEKLEELVEKNKLEELKTVASLANKYIKEHNDKLGIKSFDFSLDNIDWLVPDKDTRDIFGRYFDRDQKIKIKKSVNVPLLEVIIHEMIHFQSSIKNKEDNEQIPSRISKIGFHSDWVFTKESPEKEKDIFRGLNESVTDKIAKEIYSQKKDSLISDIKNINSNLEKENKKAIEEIKNIRLEKVDFMDKVGEKNWLEYNKDDVYNLQDYEMNGSYEGLKKYYKDFILKDFKEKKDLTIGQRYVTEYGKVGYDEEIRALDVILDKLAYDSFQEKNISLDEARENEWKELQKAFFDGNTLYLKKIDRVVGKGTLREFNKINRRNISNKGDIKNKVDDLINKIQK